MDFVLARHGRPLVVIECKWKLASDSTRNFRSFQTHYPDARLLVVATDAGKPRPIKRHGIVKTGLTHLKAAVEMASA